MTKNDLALSKIILESENIEETLMLAIRVFSAYVERGEAYQGLRAEDQEVSS